MARCRLGKAERSLRRQQWAAYRAVKREVIADNLSEVRPKQLLEPRLGFARINLDKAYPSIPLEGCDPKSYKDAFTQRRLRSIPKAFVR